MSERLARVAWATRVNRLRAQVERNRIGVVCFPIVSAVYAVHLFGSGYATFSYDSQTYWLLGKTFEHNGHFSLVSYQEQYHGYSVPLLYHFVSVVGSAAGLSATSSIKVFGVLLAATLGVIVAPRLARLLFPAASTGIVSVLALNALVFLFWRDHFAFSLSDFPTLLVGCLAALGLLRGGPTGYLVAGLASGLAFNMRPGYLLALLIVFATVLLFRGQPQKPVRRTAGTALVIAGALVALLPQILINHHQRDSWSPLVPHASAIANLQLTDGLLAQKYETYIGPPTQYPDPRVFYLDPSGIHVLEAEHIPTSLLTSAKQQAGVTGYRQYAGIVSRHPAEIAATYLRHLFNGLDVRYPTPYITNLHNTSILLSLLEYTLLFIAITRLLIPDARHALGQTRWAGVALLLSPCLLAIPGVVEPRFFLPLQLLVYMLVCFGPATRTALIGQSTSRKAGLAVAYITFLLICLTLSSATLANLQHPGATLGLRPLVPHTSA